MSENRQRVRRGWRTLVGMPQQHPAMDDDDRYAVIVGRDPRYDGVFFTAVTSTGIFCRPSCPARTPARANVRFYSTAAAAGEAGFRACKRCRPESVPGSPEWAARGDLAARAMRLIDDGTVDREGVDGLAARLGYSSRQVARVLTAELGVGPLSLAIAHRLHHARMLLESTGMPVADVAHASGFGSVRRLNEAAAARWDRTPSQVRAAAGAPASAGIGLRLSYRGPYDGTRLLAFLSARAIAGVESAGSDGYARSLALPHGPGLARVALVADADADAGPDVPPGGKPLSGVVHVTLHLADPRDVPAAVARLRRLLDLDADPGAITSVLGADPTLAPLVASAPGLRVPGAVDAFELVVRAIVGQQISVAGARTTLGAIAARWGEQHELEGQPWTLFPGPERLMEVDPESGLMPASRWRSIRAVAAAMIDGTIDLGAGADRDAARAALLAVPGIGPWTADYIAMRALHDPDAFPAGDLVLRKVVGLGERELAAASQAWRPWRAYAAMHLWGAASQEPRSSKGGKG